VRERRGREGIYAWTECWPAWAEGREEELVGLVALVWAAA